MTSAFSRVVGKLQSYLGRSSRTVADLRKGRNKTKLDDVQRRIAIYVRALWDRDFVFKSTADDFERREGHMPFVENGVIHLPAAYFDLIQDGVTRCTGLEIYRAAAAHATSHIVYSTNNFPAKSLDKLQKATISTIEDARVERLAIRRFPGLQKLWAVQHTVTPAQNETAGDFLDRLARALLDEGYTDDDPWINRGRELFRAAADLQDNRLSLDIGMHLAHELREKKIKPKLEPGIRSAVYRDDNRYVWGFVKPIPAQEPVAPTTFFESEHFSLWEFASFDRGGEKKSPVTFYDPEFLIADEEKSASEKDIKKTSALESDEDAAKISALFVEEKKTGKVLPETFRYGEWNFRSQLETPSWVTVRERATKSGNLNIIDDIIERNRHLIARMKNLLNAIRFGGMHRVRKLEEGDEIDINAAIRSRIEMRQGVQPDPRIMMRSVRKTRDISVLLLLDLSKSTNEKVQGQEHTVLELTQQVCVLFADAIKTVGDPFAIHGFCSQSRHNVEYFRLKDFDQPYDDVPKARIAGMTGQRATRMGAAIRHATYYLNKQQSRKKLLLLITDGAPDDVDVRGEEYLLFDTKKSVEGAGRSGINTFCITLDPRADRYVSRIFGARNYMVVDHIRRLPEKMLMLYAALTR
ncbi:MAG: nitric oxide reductase activation protein NorD [Burkholderiales bacterium]